MGAAAAGGRERVCLSGGCIDVRAQLGRGGLAGCHLCLPASLLTRALLPFACRGKVWCWWGIPRDVSGLATQSSGVWSVAGQCSSVQLGSDRRLPGTGPPQELVPTLLLLLPLARADHLASPAAAQSTAGHWHSTRRLGDVQAGQLPLPTRFLGLPPPQPNTAVLPNQHSLPVSPIQIPCCRVPSTASLHPNFPMLWSLPFACCPQMPAALFSSLPTTNGLLLDLPRFRADGVASEADL